MSSNEIDTGSNRTPTPPQDAKDATPSGSFTFDHSEPQGPANEEDDGRVYPSMYRVTIITVALVLATLVVALDQFVIATAIPAITNQFHSLSDIGWYGSAYQLTNLSFQPLLGKVYSRYNIKATFLIAILIFEVGSVVIATAQASHVVILGRAIAGVGASGIFAGALTIVAYTVPLRKRPLFIASITSVFGIAAVAGPLLGGVLTDNLSWRWCFWINLPIGGITVVAIVFFFHEPARSFPKTSGWSQLQYLDPLSVALLLSCVTSLLLALGWGGTEHAWSDSQVWGCLLSFGLLLITLVMWQWYAKNNASIPLKIAKQRTVMFSCLTILFTAVASSTFIFYLPIWFQVVEGVTAEQSGIRIIPLLVSNTIIAVVTAALITKLGWYTPFIWIGTAILAVGSGMLHTLEPKSSLRKWLGYQVIAGLGVGIGVQIPFVAVQVVLKEEDVAIGTALVVFSNSLGESVAISLAENIFENTLVRLLRQRLPNIDPESIINGGATAVAHIPQSDRQEFLQLYNESITTAFVLAIAGACAAFAASLFVERRRLKPK